MSKAHSFARLTCGGCAYFLLKDYGRAVCRLSGDKLFHNSLRCDQWSAFAPGISAGQDLTVDRHFKMSFPGRNGTHKSDLIFGQ